MKKYLKQAKSYIGNLQLMQHVFTKNATSSQTLKKRSMSSEKIDDVDDLPDCYYKVLSQSAKMVEKKHNFTLNV